MKKIIMLLVAIIGMTRSIAQTPYLVVVKFRSHYAVEPVWTIHNCHYRAEYRDNAGVLRAVVYDKAGYVMSSDWKMTDNYYPTRISDYYRATYPNESFAVWSSLDEIDRQTYYIIRNSEIIRFDRNGKPKDPVCSEI